jgi:uncharacterized membrane protein HdeD (DUF308 family)
MASDGASLDRSTLDALRSSKVVAYSLGAITLGAGLVLLFWPDRTITVVARLAGLLVALVGTADVIETVRNHRSGSYWGLLLVRGLLNLAFGLALLFWPSITVTVMVWLFGLDLVLTGILGLVVFRRMPDDFRAPTRNRSIATIVFGLVVLIWPSATLTVVAFLVAALLVVFGLILLWSGWILGKATHDAT